MFLVFIVLYTSTTHLKDTYCALMFVYARNYVKAMGNRMISVPVLEDCCVGVKCFYPLDLLETYYI